MEVMMSEEDNFFAEEEGQVWECHALWGDFDEIEDDESR